MGSHWHSAFLEAFDLREPEGEIAGGQAGFHGIEADVFAERPEVAGLAQEVVPAFTLPEMSGATGGFVDVGGGVTLARFTQFQQSVSGQRLHEDMDMVWHDDPAGQQAALAMPVEERVLYDVAQVCAAQ